MIDWSLADVTRITGGTLVGDPTVRVTAVGTDSRSVVSGELFVAIRGETFDGHDYANAALESGAHAVLVDRVVDPTPRIEVGDTLEALRRLAAERRDQLDMPVIAITGSSGKTTTKDLLAASLPGASASRRSFNNEIGVPLTILGIPSSASVAVVEVGSRGLGHIEMLMPVVKPDVAIITNLGVVHMETFGTSEHLADAKWELVEGLASDGVAVLPADEPRLLPPRRRTSAHIVTFGFGEPDADHGPHVAIHSLRLDDRGFPTFVADAPGGAVEVTLPVAGRHNALNAAAAIGAGLAIGVDLETLRRGLELAESSPWRMEVHEGRYTVVNDAYNANPDSMVAALQTVAAMPGRHIAVVGTMAELGHLEESEHRRIGELASSLGFELVVVGDDPGYALGAAGHVRRVVDSEQAHGVLADLVQDGDVVLIKASRSVGLEELADQLRIDAQRVTGGAR